MNSEVEPKFKTVEKIEELKNLIGELIQIRYPRHPKPDEFVMGHLGRVEESERTIDGEKIKEIVIYMKNGYRKVGMTVTFNEYRDALRETGKIHPEVYIPRVKKRGIEYIVMLEPSA